MKRSARVCDVRTGNIMHVTGEWKDLETMRKALMEDGYILISSWRE